MSAQRYSEEFGRVREWNSSILHFNGSQAPRQSVLLPYSTRDLIVHNWSLDIMLQCST